MREYYDTVHIVYIHTEQSYGTVESLGAYASMVRYQKDGQDLEELMENEDFTIVDEIVHQHVEDQD